MEGLLPQVNATEGSVNPVLEASMVTKAFSGRVALSTFSISVHAGQVHGLLGSNGSGKSTALHVMTGIIDPDHGVVLHEGIPVTRAAARSRFGLAPDDLPLPLALTGREYLGLHDSLRRRDDAARALEFAHVLDVRSALDKPMSSYSHGMKRKVQLICALMHRPSLLILDEPFRGLDPDTSEVLRSCIELFTGQGGAVLMATHDLLRAEAHCDQITMLHAGETVVHGSTREIVLEHGSLGRCFSEKTQRASARSARDIRLHALFAPR